MKMQSCCNFEILANEMLISGEMIIINKKYRPILGVKTKSETILTLPYCPQCGEKIKFSQTHEENSYD